MRDTFYERKLISGAPNDAPQARMGTFFGHMQLNLDELEQSNERRDSLHSNRVISDKCKVVELPRFKCTHNQEVSKYMKEKKNTYAFYSYI